MHHNRFLVFLLYCMVLLTLRSFGADGTADLVSMLACKGNRRQLCRDYLNGKSLARPEVALGGAR